MEYSHNGVTPSRLNCLGILKEGGLDTLFRTNLWFISTAVMFGIPASLRAISSAAELSESHLRSPLWKETASPGAPSERETQRAALPPAPRRRRSGAVRGAGPRLPAPRCFAA